MGRNQNPFLESPLATPHNKESLASSSVKKNSDCKDFTRYCAPPYLLRRYSGGGTVYHDLGNINYVMMMPRSEFTKTYALDLVLKALSISGLHVGSSGRGDIMMASYPTENSPPRGLDYFKLGGSTHKISGSAFKLISTRALSHGTMLLNSDLKDLSRWLKVQKVRIFKILLFPAFRSRLSH